MGLGNLLKTLWNRWQGATDEAAEALKDPLQEHKLNIKAGEAKLEDFRTKIANLMASASTVRRKLAEKEEAVLKYDGIAKQAAAAGKVDDVRTAATIMQKAKNEAGELRQQLKLEEDQILKLRELLADSEKKIEAAKADLHILSARYQGAKIRKEMATAASEFLGDGSLSSLDDLRKLVQQEEDVATAREDLAGSTTQAVEAQLEKTYSTEPDLDTTVQSYMASAAAAAAPAAEKKTANKK